jgi:hypothetical protein
LALEPKAANGPLSVTSGDEVLASLGYKSEVNTIGRAIKQQLLIVAANYVFTFISLWLQKPSFEEIRSHKPSDNDSSNTPERKVKRGASTEHQKREQHLVLLPPK